MANFNTRVVLKDGADRDDYEQLHEAMKERGFARIIRGRDGILYRLPDAEYNLENASLNTTEVHALASRAAKTTNRKFAILVTRSNHRVWSGLDRAKG